MRAAQPLKSSWCSSHARHRRRVPHLVGRHRLTRATHRIRTLALRASHRGGVSRRPGRQRATRGPASVALGEHRDLGGDALRRTRFPDRPTAATARRACSGIFSPRWPAWSAAPSFTYHEPLTALTDTAAWLLIAAAAVFALTKIKTSRAGSHHWRLSASASSRSRRQRRWCRTLPATPAWPESRRSRPCAHAAPRRLRSRGTADRHHLRPAAPRACCRCHHGVVARSASGQSARTATHSHDSQRARVAAGGRLPSRSGLDRRPAR